MSNIPIDWASNEDKTIYHVKQFAMVVVKLPYGWWSSYLEDCFTTAEEAMLASEVTYRTCNEVIKNVSL